MSACVENSVIRRSIRKILDRFSPEYGFIDTKFRIVTGEDFEESGEPFRRKTCVYSWIQGRGLESLAKHASCFERSGERELAGEIDSMLRSVAERMEKVRLGNGGRLPFAFYPDGKAFFPVESDCANFSDLFYSKGLFAAARRLGDPAMERGAETLFRFVLGAIDGRSFHTDQHGFDPRNPVRFVPGKYPQGPRMIALYGLADFALARPEESFWLDEAESSIRYLFEHHVNLGNRVKGLEPFDFLESVGEDGSPWRDGNEIFCDPGHALEFTGLAAKCLLAMRELGRMGGFVEECGKVLPAVFRHVFDYGWNARTHGIAKGFGLVSRRVLNSDMPWWSLPESVRAGRELHSLYPDEAGLSERADAALEGFLSDYLQPNGFACQTRSAEGRIIDVIPAVPDADPGYHTNLSLLDAATLQQTRKLFSGHMGL